ncbi:hypothetical protein HID58_016254 [Brassica napus]|uniref:C2H2-type domain-containing protein n=1 Tax=Brassica napus TaxID=3708 RepID=A0ABQ8DMD4_BRANA|nr:hypothetical protein HID58_016254 [Brassica napus]
MVTAMGYLKKAHPDLLQRLSSTGVVVEHTIWFLQLSLAFIHTGRVGTCIYMHVSLFKVRNPPPATLMLISDELEDTCPFISRCQQKRLFWHVHILLRWLWQTLLARSQAITSYDLRKCTASGDSAWSFLCDACYFTYLSVTDFTRHLSSEEHKRRKILTIKSSPHDEDEDEDEDSDSDEESLAKASVPPGVAADDSVKPSNKEKLDDGGLFEWSGSVKEGYLELDLLVQPRTIPSFYSLCSNRKADIFFVNPTQLDSSEPFWFKPDNRLISVQFGKTCEFALREKRISFWAFSKQEPT